MTTEQAPPRIQLAVNLDQRTNNFNTDPKIVNGYVEKLETGELVVVKRPGAFLNLNFSAPAGGVFFWNGHIYTIANSGIYQDNTFIAFLDSTGGLYSFNSIPGPTLFLHNTTHAYFGNLGSGLTTIGAFGSLNLTPGSAYLDATMYVFNASDLGIFGSGINDLSTWNVLNTIKAQIEPSGAMALGKQLQYVMAFKQASVEAFWDAENPVASPLQSYQGGFIPWGCKSGASVQQTEDSIFWIATAQPNGGIFVAKLTNMQMSVISTPAIERLLNGADFSVVYSVLLHVAGHRFYIITLKNSNLTLVYDATMGMWYQWTDTNGNYLPWVSATMTLNNSTIIQEENGSTYLVDPLNTSDTEGIIPVDIVTPSWDGGTQYKKYLPRMHIHGDTNGMGSIYIRHSENDYRDWSSFRRVDMSAKSPELRDCGTFKKRAYHIRHRENTRFRIKFLELHLMVGST